MRYWLAALALLAACGQSPETFVTQTPYGPVTEHTGSTGPCVGEPGLPVSGCYAKVDGAANIWYLTPAARAHEMEHVAGMRHGPWTSVYSGTEDLGNVEIEHRMACAPITASGATQWHQGDRVCIDDLGRSRRV